MLMVIVVGVGVALLLLVSYWVASGWAYRRPWTLLLLGVSVSASAVYLRWLVNSWSNEPKSPWTIEQLDIATSILDPTLVGLAGGLIGSAIFLRAQSRHLAEAEASRQLLEDAEATLDEVRVLHSKFRDDAPNMSNEQFRTALSAIHRLLDEATETRLLAHKAAREFGVMPYKSRVKRGDAA